MKKWKQWPFYPYCMRSEDLKVITTFKLQLVSSDHFTALAQISMTLISAPVFKCQNEALHDEQQHKTRQVDVPIQLQESRPPLNTSWYLFAAFFPHHSYQRITDAAESFHSTCSIIWKLLGFSCYQLVNVILFTIPFINNHLMFWGKYQRLQWSTFTLGCSISLPRSALNNILPMELIYLTWLI